MSNSETGIIESIQLCPGYRKPMLSVDRVEVIGNMGLKGDCHALPDSSRQILLLEKETLDAMHLMPGQVKENITTRGIRLMSLQSKDRLCVGDDVILEITKSCSPCSRIEEIRPGLLQEIAGRRGMLARVIRGGIISCGDSLRYIKQVS